MITASDYYPEGMQMPSRIYETAKYKFKHQGQVSDPEVYGEGNSYFYKYRMSDSRLGRFWSVDPMHQKYPHYSNYQFSGNKLISHVELEGLEEKEKIFATATIPEYDKEGKQVKDYNGNPIYSSAPAAQVYGERINQPSGQLMSPPFTVQDNLSFNTKQYEKQIQTLGNPIPKEFEKAIELNELVRKSNIAHKIKIERERQLTAYHQHQSYLWRSSRAAGASILLSVMSPKTSIILENSIEIYKKGPSNYDITNLPADILINKSPNYTKPFIIILKSSMDITKNNGLNIHNPNPNEILLDGAKEVGSQIID